MSKLNIVNELHKPLRRNFRRTRVFVKGIDYLWQADLIDMQKYARKNKGLKYILVIIDVFSKFAFTVGIKTKGGLNVKNAIEKIFKEGRKPIYFQTDDGTEFFCKNVSDLISKYGVKHYSSYSNLKASVVERFIRTIKSKLYKQFSYQGSYNWVDILSNITEEYNNSFHRTIKLAPKDVNKNNEKIILTNYNFLSYYEKPKYKKGDSVRIAKYRTIFEKSYHPNWSSEIFKISKINFTNPVTYNLEDFNGDPILGVFYTEEISKTEYPFIYLIDEVIKSKKNKLYVSWIGFDKTHNQWIDKKDII